MNTVATIAWHSHPLSLVLTLVLALMLTPAYAQLYRSSPTTSFTFDTQPAVSSSAGTIQWSSALLDRTGVLEFTGSEWLNLAQVADANGVTLPSQLSQALTFEAWVFWSSLSAGERLLEFSTSDATDTLSIQVNDLQSVTQAGFLFSNIVGSDSSTFTSLKANGSAASVTSGSWLHMVFTVTQNGATPTVSRAAATYTAFVNGNQLNSTNGYLPSAVTRSSALLGRGAGTSTPYARFVLDSFRYYNYPLSQEQVWAHAKVLTLPILDLSFGTDPRIYMPTGVNASYSWQNQDTTVQISMRRYRQGLLTFSTTADLWVDLTQASGASSIYTTWTSEFGGAPGSANGVRGWTFETMVKFYSLAAGSKVFEFATSTTTDNIFVGVSSTTASLVEFGIRGDDSVLTTLAVVTGARINTWYHVAITVAVDPVTLTRALYTVYVNGAVNATAVGSWPRRIARTTALIGRGADSTLPTFSGQVSLLRIYADALPSNDVQALYLTLNPTNNGTAGNGTGGNGNNNNATSNRWGLIYPTGPVSTFSFDTAPTAAQLEFSSFSWDYGTGDHTGLALFDGGARSLVNLRFFADNAGVYLPDIYLGGSVSFETWVKFTEFASYSRIFDFGGELGTDDTVAFGNDAISSTPQLVVGFGSSAATVGLGSFSLRNWTHIVVSISQANAFDVTSAFAAVTHIYVDGMDVLQTWTYLPRVAKRANCFFGVSNAVGRSNFRGAIDDFYVYNYSLSYEAVLAHKQVKRAPIYELVFATNPRLYLSIGAQQATYNWTARTGAGEEWHDGLLMLNVPATATTQHVSLNGVTGTNVIGTAWPQFGGSSGWTDGDSETRGWTFEFEFMIVRINANAKLFYTSASANSTANRVWLGFSSDSGADPNTLYFESSYDVDGVSRTARIVAIASVQTNAWYNLVVTIQPVNVALGTATTTVYINGVVTTVVNANTGAWLAAANRTAAYLGRSSSPSSTSPYFSAYIDSVRIFDYALTASAVSKVYYATAAAPPAIPPVPLYSNSPLRKFSFDAAISADDSNAQTPTWSASQAGRSGVLTFDGVDKYVELQSAVDDRGRYFPTTVGGSHSFELWVQFTALVDGMRVLEFAAANNSSDMLSLRVTAKTGAPSQFGLTLTNRINAASTGIDQAAGTLALYEWVYIVVTVNQTVFGGGGNNQNRTTTNALCTIYLNAVVVGQATCGTTRSVVRPTTWLGRSIATSTAPSTYLSALVDQFNWYNYALSADQVKAHAVVPSVPVGDLAFPRDPRTIAGVVTTGANFGWLYADPKDDAVMLQYHTGLLWLSSAQSQFVDLSLAAGAQSIGTTVGIVDTEVNLVNQAPSRKGSTWELSFKVLSRSSNEVLLFVGPDTANSDLFTLGFTDATSTLYFLGYSSSTSSSFVKPIIGDVKLNQWYHLVLTVLRTTSAKTGATVGVYTIRVNNVVVLTNFEGSYLRESENHHVVLGRTTSAADPTLDVMIDGFRVFDYAMTSDETIALFKSINPADYPYPDPDPSIRGSTGSGGESMSKGAIAGAVVGSIIGALIVVAVVVLITRRFGAGAKFRFGSGGSDGASDGAEEDGAKGTGRGRAPRHQILQEEESQSEVEMDHV